MNLVEFFSFFLVIVIIAASPIPQDSSSSRIQHINYHSSELDSTLLRRAPQETFELAETLDQDSNPQETDSAQNSNYYLQKTDSTQIPTYYFPATDGAPSPDYDLQGYTVAENVQSKPRPREGDTQQSSPEASDDSNIPLIPTRRFNPKNPKDFSVELEHNPEEHRHQEEQEGKSKPTHSAEQIHSHISFKPHQIAKRTIPLTQLQTADLYDQLYSRMDGVSILHPPSRPFKKNSPTHPPPPP